MAIETVGEKTGEVGPVYDVELIRTLPLGTGLMSQAMPSREDLMNVGKTAVRGCGRVVAGYEVLLSHYHRLVSELDGSKQVAKVLLDRLQSWELAAIEMKKELEADTPSPAIIRWRAAMDRLRKTLGLNDGEDIVALLEAAADVCENVASCDPSET